MGSEEVNWGNPKCLLHPSGGGGPGERLDAEPDAFGFVVSVSGAAGAGSGPGGSVVVRLPKGAETTISMAFLEMCTEKIRRLLRLIFVLICSWFCVIQRPNHLWMVLRDLWKLETGDLLLPA
jgi:hypothetical protein